MVSSEPPFDDVPRSSRRDDPTDLTPSLVARLRQGDTGAGVMLTDLYREAMIRFCYGYLRNLEDAEDAVQEIFWKVLRTEAVPDHFRAWLYRIARNHCLNVIRDRGRRDEREARRGEVDRRHAALLTGDFTRFVRQDVQDRIVELVARLPEEQREVLRLRYTEGLGRAEIAAVLDIEEKLVKSRLNDGVKRLREEADRLATEGDERSG